MKVIDGITMLKMIKDGIITNKTKLNCVDWVVSTSNNKVYVNKKGLAKWEVSNVPLTQEVLLEHHFEIIEEDKGMECPILHKTSPNIITGDEMPNWRYLIDKNFECLYKTIYKLIDEINNLKKND